MGKKNNSAIFDLFEDIAKSPPWLSIPIALLIWANYHFGWMIPSNPKSPFIPMMHMLSYAFVWMGVIAALVSIGLEIKRKLIFKNTQASNNLKDLNWKNFEIYCQQWLKNHGYTVKNNWDKGPDGGVDIHADKDGLSYIVQCKHWNKNIGVSVLRELYGIAQLENAKAIFMVSSGYTQEAINFAKKSNILCLTGDDLMPSKLQPHTQAAYTPVAPTCPKCGSELMQRTAKKGPNSGYPFLGCSAFPKCRHTQNI